MESNMEQFVEWLSKRVPANALPDYYYAYSLVEQYARSRDLIQGSLADITDATLVARISATLMSDNKYKYESPKAQRYMTSVTEQLYAYAWEKKRRDSKNKSERLTDNSCKDPLLRLLKKKGLEYIDHRSRKGCLWVIGGLELRPMMSSLKSLGIRFYYREVGGNTTKGRTAWWTKQNTTGLQLPDNIYAVNDDKKNIPSSTHDNVKERTVNKKTILGGYLNEILQQWNAYERWLQTQGYSMEDSKKYSSAIASVDKYSSRYRLADKCLFLIPDGRKVEEISRALTAKKDFTEDNVAHQGVYLAALQQYARFLDEGDEQKASEIIEETNSSVTTTAQKDVVEDADSTHGNGNAFAMVLREKFENGFRPKSIIDRNRFKQYYADYYGSEPYCTDDELIDRICKIGVMQDDRVFVRDESAQSDLIGRICTDVRMAFDGGATCVYYSELYRIYERDLAEQMQIYTSDVMKEVLDGALGKKYRSGKHYIQLVGRTPDTDREILDIMHRSSVPLNYDSLHQKLWYIPLYTIKRCLTLTFGLVLVAPETYFYAYNLPISHEELEHIATLIHDRLEQKSYLSDTEMHDMIESECPSVAINTEGLSTWGLRDCLAVLLKDQFSFNGAIISKAGNKLNMSQAYHDYCTEHVSLTLDELSAFAKEMSCSVIYWDDVMSAMIRTSRNEFIAKGQVEFDVAATDAVLDELIDGDYMSIQDFTLFLHYPPISVKWNEFVLESYVGSYSRMFTLMHLNYTATECCGAIVRNDSAITDFQALITDVLIHSDDWNTKDEALAMLVNAGYLQRKRYSKIDEILPAARLQRERLQAATVE